MKISVVIPTFNEELSIQKTLNSLVAQTLKPCEIIIADGGSTDNTLRVIEQFDGREIPIIVVNNAKYSSRVVSLKKKKIPNSATTK